MVLIDAVNGLQRNMGQLLRTQNMHHDILTNIASSTKESATPSPMDDSQQHNADILRQMSQMMNDHYQAHERRLIDMQKNITDRADTRYDEQAHTMHVLQCKLDQVCAVQDTQKKYLDKVAHEVSHMTKAAHGPPPRGTVQDGIYKPTMTTPTLTTASSHTPHAGSKYGKIYPTLPHSTPISHPMYHTGPPTPSMTDEFTDGDMNNAHCPARGHPSDLEKGYLPWPKT